MGILPEEAKRLVEAQRLGYVATVCPDGTPNLSPKGTVAVWDDDHLIFADIHSPGTIANLRLNPMVEVNVVDPFRRKGYRFKGRATIYTEGERFDAFLTFYQRRGVKSAIQSIVLIAVERVAPLISPGYDQPVTEDEVTQRWADYYYSLLGRADAGGSGPRDA